MNGKNTSFEQNGKQHLTLKDRIFNSNAPLIMGILNITPDSFFDGGKYNEEKKILEHVELMISEGADIIDIGGQSTRPGSKIIGADEELKRILPAIKLIKKEFPGITISIDTFWSKVAEIVVSEGADIINDISGGTFDSDMFKTIARINVPYVLMHIKGTPETMQKNPVKNNITEIVLNYFINKINELNNLGFNKIILDPGFGFGKSVECNYQLLKELNKLKDLGLPVLVGISRKSMINKVIETTPEEALNGTTVLNTIALQNGADILRVHDIKEAKEAIKLTGYLKNKIC